MSGCPLSRARKRSKIGCWAWTSRNETSVNTLCGVDAKGCSFPRLVYLQLSTCSCRCGGLSVTMTCWSALLQGLPAASRLSGERGLAASPVFAEGDSGHNAGCSAVAVLTKDGGLPAARTMAPPAAAASRKD